MQCDCESSNSLSASVDLKRGTGKWVVNELKKKKKISNQQNPNPKSDISLCVRIEEFDMFN